MSQKQLPFSDADQKQLSDDMKGLATFEAKNTQLMDTRETKYLIAEFPMRRAPWDFHFKTDKLTDAQSINAIAIVDGDEARYQIEISCKANERALLITTFEKKGNDGKRIPWTMGVAGAALKQIRLRIDTDPVQQAILALTGYSNAGAVVGAFDTEFKLVNSDRLILGDVFPGDQITVATAFPAQFRRLCVMTDTKAAASQNQQQLKTPVIKRDILGYKIGMTGRELISLGCQSITGATTPYYWAPGDSIRNYYSCPRTNENWSDIKMTEVLDERIVKKIVYHFARKVSPEEEVQSVKTQFGGDCVSDQSVWLKCNLGDDVTLELQPEGRDGCTLTLLGVKVEEADQKAIAEKLRVRDRPTKF